MSKLSIIEKFGTPSIGHKYVSLAHKLVRKIAREQLQPGDFLCTESKLSKEYDLSRVTIRRALALLESEDLIVRTQRKGTIVKQSINIKGGVSHFCGTILIGIPHERNLDPQTDWALFTAFTAVVGELDKFGFSSQIIRLDESIEETGKKILMTINNTENIEGFCAIGFDPSLYMHALGSIPVVQTGTYSPGSTPWIGTSAVRDTSDSIRYFLDRGHRQIALFCGPWVGNNYFADFAKGYIQAYEENGLEFSREMLYMGYKGEDLSKLAESILTSKSKPTAIFTDNWRSCQALINATKALDLKIPDDISVLSVGQNVSFFLDTVGITSHEADNAKIGRKVADVLVKLANKQDVSEKHVLFPGKIIDRGSVSNLA